MTAAKFLEQFVGTTPWIHLDIAGPSWSDSDNATRDAGGTGCPGQSHANYLSKDELRMIAEWLDGGAVFQSVAQRNVQFGYVSLELKY